jgi:hypothetical protein
VDQLPSLLERTPRLAQGPVSVCYPLVERGITVDELANCPSSARPLVGTSLHTPTIAGQEATWSQNARR